MGNKSAKSSPQVNQAVPAEGTPKAVTPSTTKSEEYRKVINDTCSMAYNSEATSLANKYDFQIQTVTWEDTGRFKGSCVGPNITDMTLQVQGNNLPVIRVDSFSDKTGDVDPKKFNLLVGNEKGQPLLRVTLYEFLDNLRDFLHDSSTWGGKRCSLIAPARDSHVLVCPQACFLPIPKEGSATFNPVLFNYQSTPGDPAVLAILVTREGTSTTILGRPEDQGKLYFNQNGQKASFTGQRKTDWKKAQEENKKTEVKKETPSATEKSAEEDEGSLNMVLLIQVPLKQKNPAPSFDYEDCDDCESCEEECEDVSNEICDIEDAVIGHGEVEGEFKEIDGLDIERDDRFPIRVTLQFYKATSNGVMSEQAMKEIAEQLNKVYAEADSVGSLVVSGNTGRVTEYDGNKIQPPNWWNNFWSKHEQSGTWVPDYLLMRQVFTQTNGTQFFPSTEDDAETLFKKLSSERSSNN